MKYGIWFMSTRVKMTPDHDLQFRHFQIEQSLYRQLLPATLKAD